MSNDPYSYTLSQAEIQDVAGAGFNRATRGFNCSQDKFNYARIPGHQRS